MLHANNANGVSHNQRHSSYNINGHKVDSANGPLFLVPSCGRDTNMNMIYLRARARYQWWPSRWSEELNGSNNVHVHIIEPVCGRSTTHKTLGSDTVGPSPGQASSVMAMPVDIYIDMIAY